MQKPYFPPEYYKLSVEALQTGLYTAPVYKSWQKFDPGKSAPVDERYSALPELTKKEIRDHFPKGLVPGRMDLEEGLKHGKVEYVQTSGTTAEKVTNIWNQSWWNDSESASWLLNRHTKNLDHSSRQAQLASSLSVGYSSEDNLPMRSRLLDDRILFLNEKVSTLEWNNDHYERMIAELAEFKPAVLEANPSLLARLAWWTIDNKRTIVPPGVIILTYEYISRMHFDLIKKAFPVPLVSSFGSTEAGYIFMQCEYGTYHQNTEFCRLDFEPLKTEHGGPNVGRILVTIFKNPWVSLIRFDTGDLVHLKDEYVCRCGRKEGYMASAIVGRTANATYNTSGKLVTTKDIDDALSSVQGIRDYQLRQTSEKEYMLKIKINSNKDKILRDAENVIFKVYGKDVDAGIEICDEIEPSPSGKYRRTQALFDYSEKDLFT